MFLEQQAIEYFRRFDFSMPVLGFKQGDFSSRVLGRNMEFEQYNAYRPGDNLKDIDWKVYGRSQKLFIKKYGSDLSTRVRIILDCSRSMDYQDKQDKSRKIAALLGYLLKNFHSRVILAESTEHFKEYPENISLLEVQLAGLKYQGLSHPERFSRKKEWTSIFISDLWIEPSGIDHLVREGIHVIHILSREEVEFNLTGNLELIDLETQSRLEVIPAAVRKEYLSRLRDRNTRLARQFRQAGLSYALFDHKEPYYVQLKDFLLQNRIGKGSVL